MKLLMILLCKGTCALVATSFKRQGEVPLSCTPYRQLCWVSHQLN